VASDHASPTLVIMAAGRGARYGGAKQLDEVGASGETLLDYAVFDARRAGFSRIVMVTREDLVPSLEALLARFPSDLDVRCVVQGQPIGAGGTVPRNRPWGTVHAVLSSGAVDGQTVVALNADDFYGRAAYDIAKVSSDWAVATGEASVIAMRLDATLSEQRAWNQDAHLNCISHRGTACQAPRSADGGWEIPRRRGKRGRPRAGDHPTVNGRGATDGARRS